MNFQNMIPDFELRKKIISFLEPVGRFQKDFVETSKKIILGIEKTSKMMFSSLDRILNTFRKFSPKIVVFIVVKHYSTIFSIKYNINTILV